MKPSLFLKNWSRVVVLFNVFMTAGLSFPSLQGFYVICILPRSLNHHNPTIEEHCLWHGTSRPSKTRLNQLNGRSNTTMSFLPISQLMDPMLGQTKGAQVALKGSREIFWI